MQKLRFLTTTALMFCSAVAWAGSLQIREGYVRELPPGQSTSAAYMSIVNDSDRPVAIVAATSDAAQTAEISVDRREGGAMRMEMVRRLVIPAHAKILLAPAGYQLVLTNLKHSLHAGESINVTLLDEEGRSYNARLPVVKMLGVAR